MGCENAFRVLFISESTKDSIVVEERLRDHWPAMVLNHVQNFSDLQFALSSQVWNCVLCESPVPGLSAVKALKLTRQSNPELPFIILTDSVSLEAAIDLIKRGANDIVRKDDLSGLKPAIDKAQKEIDYTSSLEKSQRDLQHSEQRLSDAQRIALLGHYSLDIKSGLWTCSAQTADIFGIDDTYTRDVESWLQMVHPDFRQSMSEYLSENILRDHNPFDKEYKIVAVNSGLEKWVHGLGHLVFDDDRNPIEMFGTIQDIDKRKRTELALRSSEAQWRALIDTMPDLIWLKDTQTAYIACNQLFEMFHNVKEAEILGKTDFDLGEPQFADECCEHDQKVLDGGEPFSREIEIRSAVNGCKTILDITKVPMYASDGEIIGVLGIGRDITERKIHEAFVLFQSRRTKALREIQRIADTLSEEDFVRFGLDKAEELTGSGIAFCRFSGINMEQIDVFTSSEGTQGQQRNVPGKKPSVAEDAQSWIGSLSQKTPIIINDFSGYEESDKPSGRPAELRRLLCLPIIESDKIVCLLGVGNKHTDYTDQDVETVQMIVDEVSQVLQRQRLESRAYRFSRVIEQSLNEIYMFNHETLRFCEVNKQALSGLGYSMEELKELTPVDIVPQFTTESFDILLEPLRSREEQALILTTVHRRKDQSTYPVEVHLQLMDENPPMFVAIIRNIDDRLRMEGELRKLAQTVEQSPNYIMITNLKGEIEYVNEAFLNSTGYKLKELIGKNPRILQSGKTPPETYVSLWNTLGAGKSWEGEFYNQDRYGREYIEHAIIAPVRNEKGVISHYVGVKDDITERKQLNQELEAHRYHLEELVSERTSQLAEAMEKADLANRAKSSFLANMSHEIRTPMNAIIGLTDLLQRENPTQEQAKRLAKIDTSADHLLAIISDILDISKIEAGKLSLEQSDFDLTSIFEHIHQVFREAVETKELTLKSDLANTPTWLKGDSTRLRQALLNYTSNAIKFTDQGSVSLRANVMEEKDKRLLLRFEVRDSGCGIDADSMSGLFNAFEQGDVSTTRKFGGTGLGLAITQRLARLMGGSVGAESEPGEGSMFWFTAWFGRGEGETSDTSAGKTRDVAGRLQVHGAGLRVLLAEDNATNREVAVALLSSVGLIVETAENGCVAVEMASKNMYDLILMDVQMPELDGLDATRLIRASRDTESVNADVPILAMTANVFEEDRQACADAGMNDFVAKPVEPDDLFSKIIAWTSQLTENDFSIAPPVTLVRNKSTTSIDVRNAPQNDVPINIELLVSVFGDEPIAHSNILQKFVSQTEEILADFGSAYRQRNLEQITFQSHKLKSSARTVGADILADLCLAVEMAGMKRNWHEVDNLVDAMSLAVDQVREYVLELQDMHESQG